MYVYVFYIESNKKTFVFLKYSFCINLCKFNLY